jgi:hypothetical protein
MLAEAAGEHPASADREGIMFTNPGAIGQIASQHHHELIADARQQRRLLHEQDRPAPRTVKITRRLAMVMARVGVAPARP